MLICFITGTIKNKKSLTFLAYNSILFSETCVHIVEH